MLDVKLSHRLRRELFASARRTLLPLALVKLGGLMTTEIHATLKDPTRTTLIKFAASRIVPRKSAASLEVEIAVVTKPRIREPQEVHPVFTLFTVMFTFKFSPDVFCSPLSFSPSLALVDPKK